MARIIKILVVAVMLCSACNKSHMSSTEYLATVVDIDKGAHKVIKVSDMVYDVQYKPTQFIVFNEQLSDSDKVKRLDELNGTIWFNIQIKNNACVGSSFLKCNVSSQEEYSSRLNYFLSGAALDFKLMYDDSIELHRLGYVFENNYGLTPTETIVIGFSLPSGEKEPSKDFSLQYHDRLFRNGIVKASFKATKIRKLSMISIQSQ